MDDWIIIGGGIQGCTVASYLLKSQTVTRDRLRIIDPHNEPLSNWRRMTSIIEMPYLRSPSVHHIDVKSFSLQTFAKVRSYTNHFYGLYKRPSLELFNTHSDEVLKDTEIHNCWQQGRVQKIVKSGENWVVHTEEGDCFYTRNLVIAIGVTEQPHWPSWTKSLRESGCSGIYHIFNLNQQLLEVLKPPFLIVGGGVTAAHLSVKLAKKFPKEVTLLARHPFRIHDFDSDPGWLGQKHLRSFHKLKCYVQRRKRIIQARNRGSLPRDVLRTLLSLKSQNNLRILYGQINCVYIRNQDIEAELINSSDRLLARSIILATGFEQSLPGGAWLHSLIKRGNLPCAECGYPIVSEKLEWDSQLYVVGALAELELGPVARNIAGARMAAEKIVSSVANNSL